LQRFLSLLTMKILSIALLLLTCQAVYPTIPVDSAVANIYRQILAMPQEKIYIQTDKPVYFVNETVYYRLFLLNSCLHTPSYLSRFIYVELIDMNRTVVLRQKIMPDSVGVLHNTLKLSDALPQGYYTIRAYTKYMENFGIENFYSKPVFVISENKEHLKMELEAKAKNIKQTSIDLHFVNSNTGESVTPTKLFVQLNGKRQKLAGKSEDFFTYDLNLTESDRNRTLFVQAFDTHDSVMFQLFDVVPYTKDSIEVSFFPEGGYVVDNKPNVIAFKALHQDGKPADISGVVKDNTDSVVASFNTAHEGMGHFYLTYKRGRDYYAEYQADGDMRIAQLPVLRPNKCTLHTEWDKDSLRIILSRKEGANTGVLYLLAHCRGKALFGVTWLNDTDTVSVAKTDLPAGVCHLLLLNALYQPVSERLVFSRNNECITPEIKTDKSEYRRRDHIKLDFAFAATDTKPSFSVSVTDDKEVETDTTDNILTRILLVSDLKGHIANPAYYFSDHAEVEKHADLLMLTHGWTRYDIPAIMQGKIDTPIIEPEKFQILTGTVRSGLIPQTTPNVEVSMMSYQGTQPHFDVTVTDSDGRFKFENFNLPDSSGIVVQALKGKKKRKWTLDVVTDTIVFPSIEKFGMPDYQIFRSNPRIEQMASEADWRFEIIDGMRVIKMPEIIVKARDPNRKPKNNTVDFTPVDFFFTADEIAETGITNVFSLLSQLPMVRLYPRGKKSEIRILTEGIGVSEIPAIVRINGVKFGDDDASMGIISDEDVEFAEDIYHDASLLGMVNITDIEEILIINKQNKLDNNTKQPTIDIRTKGGLFYDRSARYHFKAVMPLGYSVPAEFYSPQYDTPAKRNSDEPDLRSTIYWKPSVLTDDEGKAVVEFYSADKGATYSVVTEGICPDGTLIYKRSKALIKVNSQVQ